MTPPSGPPTPIERTPDPYSPLSGLPTPIGVGGPTPPLVSGSKEEWKMRIHTWGSPTSKGGGFQHLPLRGEGGSLPLQGEAKRLPLLKGWTRSLPLLNEEERCLPHPGRERRASPYPGREREGREKREGEPPGPMKTIDTTLPHKPGTSHARFKREPPPKGGQTVYQRNRHPR